MQIKTIMSTRDSLTVQWIGFLASTAGGTIWIPDQLDPWSGELGICMPVAQPKATPQKLNKQNKTISRYNISPICLATIQKKINTLKMLWGKVALRHGWRDANWYSPYAGQFHITVKITCTSSLILRMYPRDMLLNV